MADSQHRGSSTQEGRAKIAVLGATGRTGHLILEQALESGLQVTALARDTAKLGRFRDSVKAVQGNVADPRTVEEAVAGNNFVLSALGLVRDSPPGLMAEAAANIISAMRRQESRRLVVLTNTAVEDPSDRPPLRHRLVRFSIRWLEGRVWRESRAAAQLIEGSGLDWTLVRAPVLSEGPKTSSYRVGALDSRTPLRVSRADVAEFMLSCALQGKFLRSKPVIAG